MSVLEVSSAQAVVCTQTIVQTAAEHNSPPLMSSPPPPLLLIHAVHAVRNFSSLAPVQQLLIPGQGAVPVLAVS